MAMMSDPPVPEPAPDPAHSPEPPPEPIDVPSPVPDNAPPPNEPTGVPPVPPPEIPVIPTTTAEGPQHHRPHPQRRPVTTPARSTSTFRRSASRSVV